MMIKSNRTKRRKTKQEMDNILKMYSINHSDIPEYQDIENHVTHSTDYLNLSSTIVCQTDSK